ncbi:sigma-70 family RNA polymerase sigma factor [Sessilibacter corallicola]|uniref:RNA polymerase sigma factor RpoE n=1 Tax=Sessilibacter corallicola TaxID=2904075 RepID=A0ABQ0A3S5_9GAMM
MLASNQQQQKRLKIVKDDDHSTEQSNKKPESVEDRWTPLLVSVADKNRAAFEQLFNHFAPLIRGYSRSKPSPTEMTGFADELVQEVMIKIWQKAHSFNPEKASASTWIFTLVRNCRVDMLRRNNRHNNQTLETDDIWPIESEDTPITHLQQSRDQERLFKAAETLPPEQMSVISKVFVEGKTHTETASELGLPLGTVKSRVRLALKKLQVMVTHRINEVDL